MFIRKTKKTDLKNGQVCFLFQLVESIRTERGPRQNIILNLGTDLELDVVETKILANRIEEIITNQDSFLPPCERIERLAQHFSAKILALQSQSVAPVIKINNAQKEVEFHTIDINSIEHENARTVGLEHLLLHSIEQLKLTETLRSLGLDSRKIAIAIGSICARAIAPNSERGSLDWLQNQSGLGELLGYNFQETSLTQFYRISDILLRNKDAIENHLIATQNQIFHRVSSLILYDLTNTYMEGQARDNPKACYGHSKEKRTDCPLVTIGLAVDEYGFLLKSEFLPGNVSEPRSLKQAISSLMDPEQLFQPTILMDAGIATDENLQWLKQNKFSYIVSARQDAPFPRTDEELEVVSETGVKAAILHCDTSEDTWLYCESPAKEATATQMKTAFQTRFEKDLENICKGIGGKQKKSYVKVVERIGRLKEKHKRISSCYEINVTPSADGKMAIGCAWRRLEEKLGEKLTGNYYLRTNISNMPAQQLWSLYQTIRTVEDAFRFMKSSLGMRPIFHQKEARVDGHLWITVLAYSIIHNLLHQLRHQGLRLEWETIHAQMQNRIRVTMQARTKEEKVIRIRTTTKPEVDHNKIYEKLHMSSAIHRTTKSIV